MTPDERNLINGLFDRLRSAEANAPAKDRDADQLIQQLTAQSPGAPYLLTQTLLVQEHALANAQARIQALERQAAQAQQQHSAGGGGFLSGLFGSHSTPTPPTPPPMPAQVQPPTYPTTMTMAPSSGGGFLRNALTTAAGVAGGAMLFQGIENLLGHNSGPFGSGLGGGGFLNTGGPQEVTNNYYGEGPASGSDHGGAGAGGGDYNSGGGIPAGGADQPAQPGYEDAGFNDAKFDNSNPFDQPANDNSFLSAGSDSSSLDNSYDLDNTDAGGGDFAGGDSSGGGDDGTV